MRFAYIDSQGKEVGIPTVDALQLRIELGAIGESTMFYDASADKWAPAGEHEIFTTLSRELKERQEGTFVAPPPPAAGRGPAARGGPSGEGGPRSEEARPRTPDPFRTGPGHDDEDAADPFDPAGFETLEPGGLSEIEARGDAGGGGAGSGDDLGFDFGDLQGLELAGGLDQIAGPELETEDTGDARASDDGGDADPGTAEEDLPLDAADGAAAAPPVPPAGGGLELERTFAEQHDEGATDGVEAQPLELEARLSDYDDEAPSWLQDAPDDESAEVSADDPDGWAAIAEAETAAGRAAADALERRPPRSEGGDGDGAEGRPYQRRAPRHRPEPPPRRKKRRPLLPLVLVAGVAVAAAGWYGWSVLLGGGGTADDEAPPEVVIPDIDPTLEPRMREVARLAYIGMLDEMRATVAGHDLPEEPDAEWLSGNYLGNASEFEEIQSYWLGFRDALAHVRSSEDDLFESELAPLLDSPDLDDDERDQIRARALAGFEAAAPDRRQVYEQFRALTEAALDLHGYLLDNEENIDYTPAAGGLSRDPVVEAVPITPELGEEMWARVGRIPDALDRLGALDKVTTPRLLDLLVQKLDATPIR